MTKLAAALLLATSVAAADTPHEQADQLYKLGRDQLAAGKLAEACESFAKSDAADPAVTTLLALGVCREKQGMLATAAAIYTEVGRRTQGSSDPTSAQLGKVAAANLAKVEPRLSHLTILAPANVEVRRGEGIVPPESYGKPIAIDGGTYALSARASGREPWTTTVTIAAEKDAQTVQVPALQTAGTVATIENAGHRSNVLVTTQEQAPSRALPIGVAVGAVALGAVAVVLEVSARSTYDDSKREADDTKQTDLWHSANHKRYAAEGFGIAGVAAAGVAVFLFVHGGHREEPRVSIAPVLTNDQIGLAIGGRY